MLTKSKVACLVFVASCVFCSTSHQVSAQKPADKRDALAVQKTARLFVAIRDNDTAGIAKALSSGSDPNGRNWLGYTPLDWACVRGHKSHVEYLLAHGARINDPSPYGNALTISLIGRHRDIALYLIGKGANIHAERGDGATSLMLAASNGFDDVVTALIAHGDDPNVADKAGDTALIYAARAGSTSVQTLLKYKARVDMADLDGKTALMEAAAADRPAAVEALIAAGARVDLRDKNSNTALLLAGKYGAGSRLVDALIQAGANPRARDHFGSTALSLAISRGHSSAASSLRKTVIGVPSGNGGGNGGSTQMAVKLSINAIQKGMTSFAEQARCGSCHHQGLGLMALGAAKDAGFEVDGKLIGQYLAAMGEDVKASGPAIHQAVLHPELAPTLQAVDIGEMPIGAGYMMSGMLANHIPGNPGLAEALQIVANEQQKDGNWMFGVSREPMQGSFITTTALVVRVLKEYGPKSPSAHIAERIARAKAWLLAAKPTDAEGRAAKLLGLKWSGAPANECDAAASDLMSLQKPDGGWAEAVDGRSDAYATGFALYALITAKTGGSSSAAIAQAIRNLVRTQDEDGTWFVYKHTMPANNYFDAGFPHGESQYASFAATCWSVMALTMAGETSRTAQR